MNNLKKNIKIIIIAFCSKKKRDAVSWGKSLPKRKRLFILLNSEKSNIIIKNIKIYIINYLQYWKRLIKVGCF